VRSIAVTTAVVVAAIIVVFIRPWIRALTSTPAAGEQVRPTG
jgi:hypothetical protein